MDRLQRVNSSLHSQISRLQNIRNTIEETGILAEQARSRVESTEQLIEIASRELEKAKMAAANVVSDSEVPVGRVGCWETCSRSFYSTENLPQMCLHPPTWIPGAGEPCCSSSLKRSGKANRNSLKQERAIWLVVPQHGQRTAVGSGRSVWCLLTQQPDPEANGTEAEQAIPLKAYPSDPPLK